MRWTQTINDDTVTIELSGNIDETANQNLIDLASSIRSPKVIFDCQNINTVNSIGISSWTTFIKGIQNQHQLRFRNCPQVFLEVCLMIPIATGGGIIESLYLTYPCKGCAKTANVLIDAKDLNKHESLLKRTCERCGEPMSVVEDVDEYANMLNI